MPVKKKHLYPVQRPRPARFIEVQVRDFRGGTYGYRSRTFVCKGEFEFFAEFMSYVLREYIVNHKKKRSSKK